jgi:hypothetical protein
MRQMEKMACEGRRLAAAPFPATGRHVFADREEWNTELRHARRWGKWGMLKITIDTALLPSMFVFMTGLMLAGALANLNQQRQ